MVTATSRIEQSTFGVTREGREVTCFTLRGGGMTAEVLDYGAIVRALHVPDARGRAADVVLGYDDLAGYERDRFYLGAVVGRYANRIRNAAFELDGRRFQLTANASPHHLHGGARGFGKQLWRARAFDDGETAGVVMEHTSPDGDEGYPGKLDVTVTYALSGDGVFGVDFRAATDRATPVNLAQHAYFNLAGEGSGDVLGHELAIHARAYTPLDETHVPTGEIAPVAETPLDFRQPHRIGERIGDTHAQLRIARGYDHNYVLDAAGGGLAPAARMRDPGSGRMLEVFTTQPGMQLYSGNFLDGSTPGKHGQRYGRHAGLCLETQHFPDSPNQPAFPSTILRPSGELRARTEFRFSAAEGAT
ncbi:MAG TPA: aldose epimerase family protein [Longimicrobium sp.]